LAIASQNAKELHESFIFKFWCAAHLHFAPTAQIHCSESNFPNFAPNTFLQLKKIGYILLLTILLLQAGGMLLIYKMQQCYVKQEMQQTLNNSKTKFQKITLSLSEYQKSKINSHEISINGKMYDVKSVNILENNVKLLVINDSKEENILQKIKDFTNRTNQPNSDLPNQLQQLLSLNYLSPEIKHFFFIPVFSINLFRQPNLNLVSNDSDIPSPPPKLV
jgi:hypothetical protein